MSVSSRDNEREDWKDQFTVALLPFLEQHGMNMTFEMIHCDQRLVQSEGQRLGIADAD